MISVLRADLFAAAASDRLSTICKVAFFSHSFHLVVVYRFGTLLSTIPMFGSFFRVIIEYFIRIVFSSDISLKSKIGPGFVVVHGHDIVIGGDVLIGENCKIFNGVTLGNKDTETSVNQQPKVGDDVVLGTGAKILGRIVIGNNVRVGANSVVLHSIPDGAIAVGVPARYKIEQATN
ncbi:serine acetyltransferase [Vibrio cholerae]|uniref:serine O-acetyltransferase n=1 Tax=Vibrio cholerae TaxID=666 RepID=UPI0011D7DE8E|nr:serine acetyltransferase [Vibrio cholerae]EGR2500867.1 serine acetyltransferase [Vibrio cholerae]TXZ44366.1 serine acetyltransferase [Vibrio cholerae]BCN20760.1 serine acetyltransferase [Vibrio cholerae]GIC12917.1 serine acetyltransferase [Vibrio cholerae]